MYKNIKCCVYLIKDKEPILPCLSKCPIEYQQFFKNKPRFCDIGDDPSFYCAERYNYNVTWGVCRHNVRQGLNVEDEVHYVACDKTNSDLWQYYYVGYGIVEKTITQKDIYNNRDYVVFKKYFNLLITSNNNEFIHNEPLPFEYWHEDWKMRLFIRKRIKELNEIEENREHGLCGIRRDINLSLLRKKECINSKFPFGKNYIIYSRSLSKFNLNIPILIATVKWEGGSLYTNWQKDCFQNLFSNIEKRESFTNKSRQHTVFNLLPDKSEVLKGLV
jgi:hypothetical protein